MFQWIGPDHKIVVEAYDDPKVAGVTCYVSRAKTGGIKGGAGPGRGQVRGLDRLPPGRARSASPSRCRQQEDMFTERISLVFKKLRVVRMVDTPSATRWST